MYVNNILELFIDQVLAAQTDSTENCTNGKPPVTGLTLRPYNYIFKNNRKPDTGSVGHILVALFDIQSYSINYGC